MTDRTGRCRLCNEEKTLTFEHIPPRSAYNRDRVQAQTLDVVDGEGLVAVPGRYQQRGAGGYYLCADCNNFLGREYVPDYQRFVRIIGESMLQADGIEDFNETEQFPHFRMRVEKLEEHGLELQPSRVAKQAVSMLLCAGGPGFAEQRQDLRQYVLDPMNPDFPEDLSLGVCFFLGPQARFSGPTSKLHLGPPVTVTTYLEVAFPPLAWLLILENAPVPEGLADFKPWLEADVGATLNGFAMEAQVGFAATLFPGDFRTEGQLRAHLRNQAM